MGGCGERLSARGRLRVRYGVKGYLARVDLPLALEPLINQALCERGRAVARGHTARTELRGGIAREDEEACTAPDGRPHSAALRTPSALSDAHASQKVVSLNEVVATKLL